MRRRLPGSMRAAAAGIELGEPRVRARRARRRRPRRAIERARGRRHRSAGSAGRRPRRARRGRCRRRARARLPARLDVGDRGACRGLRALHRPLLRRIGDVDEMVHDLGPLGRASASRCRCRGPGTPASSRARRARRRRRPARARAPAPTCPTRSDRRARGAASNRHDRDADPRGAARAGPARSSRRAASAARRSVTRAVDEVARAPCRRSGAKCSSLFWRVRPDHIAASVFDGPSTSTSSTRPTRASCFVERRALDDLGQPLHPLADDLGRDEVVGHRRPPRCRAGARTRTCTRRRTARPPTTSSVRSKSSSVSPGNPTMMSVVTARSSIAARAAAEPLEVARRPCSRGACAPACGRCPTATAGAGARTRSAHSAIAAIVSGAEVLRVRRREADALDAVDRVDRAQQVGELRPVLARAEVAAVGVDVLAEQRDLDARRRRRAPRPRATMSPMRRLTSRPRTDGTMQNAHELSQPIWIVTQAAWSTSRRAGSADGYSSCSSRISTTGPSTRARSSSVGRVREVVGAEHDVDVRRPARAPARGPSGPGSRRPRSAGRAAPPSAPSAGRGARRACCRRSPGCSRC